MKHTHSKLLQASEELLQASASLSEAHVASTVDVITSKLRRLLALSRELRNEVEYLAEGIVEDGLCCECPSCRATDVNQPAGKDTSE